MEGTVGVDLDIFNLTLKKYDLKVPEKTAFLKSLQMTNVNPLGDETKIYVIGKVIPLLVKLETNAVNYMRIDKLKNEWNIVA